MKAWDNQLTIILLTISNLVAILQLVASLRWPRISRLSFFALFTWAAWTNWHTASQHPDYYLDYAQLAWSGYAAFIRGWFALHITWLVQIIAVCQALIALSVLLKGWIYTIGCIGAIIFLVAILPLGTGAGFPCTGIMAAAVYVLMRKGSNRFIWQQAPQDKSRIVWIPSRKSQYP